MRVVSKRTLRIAKMVQKAWSLLQAARRKKYQRLDVDVVPPDFNFIKKETLPDDFFL